MNIMLVVSIIAVFAVTIINYTITCNNFVGDLIFHIEMMCITFILYLPHQDWHILGFCGIWLVFSFVDIYRMCKDVSRLKRGTIEDTLETYRTNITNTKKKLNKFNTLLLKETSIRKKMIFRYKYKRLFKKLKAYNNVIFTLENRISTSDKLTTKEAYTILFDTAYINEW